VGRLWGVSFCVVVVLAAVRVEAARPKSKAKTARWVTFVHAVGEVPGGWPIALRRAAEGAGAERSWLPPPALGIDELTGTLGCATWDAACAGAAASVLGADHALRIEIVASTERREAIVSAQSVDRAGATPGPVDAITVSADDDGLALATTWIAGLVNGERPTIVVVQADLPGTEVLLDGERVGVTPLRLTGVVAPGRHVLELRREGRAPLRENFDVAPGALVRVTRALAQGPPMTSTPTVGEAPPAPAPMVANEAAPSTLRFVGYGVGGLGAVVSVVGVVVAGHASATLNGIFVTAPDGTEAIRPGICEGPDGTFLAPGCRSPLSPQEVADDLFVDGQSRNPQSRIAAFRGRLQDSIQLGAIVAGAGVLVGVTGLALAFGAAPGEVQDAGSAGSEIRPK
jgi:hypothetical protein